ncbi:hypothetical protein ONS95_002385 [Cadophora gregata]|uniref:uncharacterized protein n=1 Tax=Cadophora gregata TaxID=51156 RepID=UPI0026DB1664|nr:uncharacterized protein ONS95_002385 [Cadophora gregata]KAK0109706.1 hypothetical protein ONS95_002385 [Cadophora gregata]
MPNTMASPTPSIATITPKTRPRRQSRFTEGSPLTGAELAQQTADNDFLLTILSQMDEHEKRKQRSESNASTESFTFSGRSRRNTGSSNGGSSPVQGDFTMKEHVGRRSITFGRTSNEDARRSLDEKPKEFVENVEGLAIKFKGRLRALTGGKERSAKPYPGT